MKLSYDPRYNIAYIHFSKEKATNIETIRISDELCIDMAPDGTIYGIELLNANEQLRRDGMQKLVVVNEFKGDMAELPLAV
jgi:uncharacterized protein YuzE